MRSVNRDLRRHTENLFTVKTGGKLFRNQNKSCCKNAKLEIIGLIVQNSVKKYSEKNYLCFIFFCYSIISENNTPASAVEKKRQCFLSFKMVA